MKRRDQGISNAWSFLLGFVILTVVVPGVLIGPARAVRIIGSAVSNTIVERPVAVGTDVPDHALPVVDLHISNNELVFRSVHYPIVSENMGDRTVVHFDTAGGSPFGPFNTLLIKEPAADLLSGTLALWVAGRMSVPIVSHRLIFLQQDGQDVGLREMAEVVDRKFEQYRNVSDLEVDVFRVKEDIVPGTDPWKDIAHWDTRAANGPAIEQFNKLLTLLNDTLIEPADRRNEMASLMDEEAFDHYCAAMFMLGVTRETPARTVIVLDPRIGKFIPVLVEAPLVPATDVRAGNDGWDLLTKRLLEVADRRKERDRLVQEAIASLHRSGEFDEKVSEFSHLVSPSIKNPGKSRRPLFSMQGAAAGGLEWGTEDLQRRVSEYWNNTVPVVSSQAAGVEPIVP